jgi:hypothetical protein
METKTHFDLTSAIEKWRQELTSQPHLSAENQRELETHLCDTVTELQQRGLNDEESFWLARRRVGQPEHLAEEFVKADPAKVWRERVFWMALSLVGSYVFMTWKDLLASWLNGENYNWIECFYLIPLLVLIVSVVVIRRGRIAHTNLIENISSWKLACGLFAVLAATVLSAYFRSRHLPGSDLANIGYNIGMTLSWFGNAVWPLVAVLILLLTLKQKRKIPQRG